MSGKNLINSVDNTVNESLIGYVLTYPHLELHASKRVVLKPAWSEASTKVTIISGGGSGHEPFSAGFVGSGMLSASVAGSVYAAPSSSQAFHAIQCLSARNKAGCLVIIPNYTGDCLNFGFAIEKAKNLGLKVAQVIVGEDCSIPDNELGRAGKRALPGILLVIKVAGALAEKNHSLEEVTKYAQLIADNTASCSVGLTACNIPGHERAVELEKDVMEFGRGLHGEAGYKKVKLLNAADTVALMLGTIVKTLKLTKEHSVVVLINNFGALSQLEQGIIAKEVVTQLQKMEILPVRVYCGLLMTSLDSSGVHVSILKLPESEKPLILSALDDKTEAPAWPGCSYSTSSNYYEVPVKEERTKRQMVGPKMDSDQQHLLKTCLQKACQAIVKEESFINDLDRGCGDGDCGTTLKHLAEGILAALPELPFSHPSSLLSEIANISEDRMGGTSGAIYCLLLATAASELATVTNTSNWLSVWAQAWRAGINGIMKYSKARLGDKTMIDVLEPSQNELHKNISLPYKEAAKKVATRAIQSAEATKNLLPKAGRASYVKQEEYLKGMDAGAYATAVWINAMAQAL